MIFSEDDIIGLPALGFVKTRDDLSNYVQLLQSMSESDLGLNSVLGETVFATGSTDVFIDSEHPSTLFIDEDSGENVSFHGANVQVFSLSANNELTVRDSDVTVMVDPDTTQSFEIRFDTGEAFADSSAVLISSTKMLSSESVTYDPLDSSIAIGGTTLVMPEGVVSRVQVIDPAGTAFDISDLSESTSISADTIRKPKATGEQSPVTETADVDFDTGLDDTDLTISDSVLVEQVLSQYDHIRDYVPKNDLVTSDAITLQVDSDEIYRQLSHQQISILKNISSELAMGDQNLADLTSPDFSSGLIWNDASDFLDGLI